MELITTESMEKGRWSGKARPAQYRSFIQSIMTPQSYKYAVDDHPEGYPQLAAFLNSDENFLLCRRFGFLHSRVLLYRQDELHQLETRLLALDQADAEESPLVLKSREADNEQDEQEMRKVLIGRIDEKLKEYGMAKRDVRPYKPLTNCFRWSYTED